ncbi:hypothetical protein HYZ99_02855, partial [Candidatus Peregrinibacteria bacterium]|nr:hypothetical protein [Candidatus Peregrinibacteria bacterium]
VAADLAEIYYTNDVTLEAGEIVSIDPSLSFGVRRTQPGDKSVLGVVSTKPGLLIGGGSPSGIPTPIALAGRVPVRVTTENGAIEHGDYLTISSQSGVAMKSLGVGPVIGQALEAWRGDGIGSVMVFVKNFEQSGFAVLSGSGSIPDRVRINEQLMLTADDVDDRALLVLDTEETDGSKDALRIVTDAGSDENLVTRITASGAIHADGPVSTTGADYAEWFFSEDAKTSIEGARQALTPGEVVCIDVTAPNAVRRCARDADNNVMGIVSTNPAFIGNSLSGADGIRVPGTVLVGLIGQVPGKVIVQSGAVIRPGDSLTPSSIPGIARRAEAGEPTVGVALEGLESGQGTIKVLISRRNQSLTAEAVEERIMQSIAGMEIEDEVQVMLAQSLDNLNFNAKITDEVHAQVSEMDFIGQIQSVLSDRLGTGSVLGTMENVLALTDEHILELRTAFRVVGPTTLSGSLQVAGVILGTSLELDQNLTVGGSARVGKDLHVDGSLIVNEIMSPNSLFVDGDLNLGGTIHASAIDLASGGTLSVAGGLTLNGKLTVESLEITKGSIAVEDLLVRGAMEVMGDITISGLARFLGDVDVSGQLIVSNRQAGYAKIPKTGTAVTIVFGSGFTATPIVSASPDVPVLYAVSKASMTGFTIRLGAPATEDIGFSWLALATAAPETAEGGEGSLSGDKRSFTVDAQGVPYSASDPVFNACIRNQATGCDDYRRDTYEWILDDVIFTYRTDLTPPLLVVPEGYEIVVVEGVEEVVPEGTEESDPSTSLRAGESNESGPPALDGFGGAGEQTPEENAEPVPAKGAVPEPEEIPAEPTEPVIAPEESPAEPVIAPEQSETMPPVEEMPAPEESPAEPPPAEPLPPAEEPVPTESPAPALTP